MCFLKCFDIVDMVVEEANNQFAPIWKLDKERYDILKQYCNVIDNIANEHNGESYQVDIDDIAMTIAITMECLDMVVDSDDNEFLAIAQRAISVSFSASDEGKLAIKFIFPSLWERT